jgi:hypothetical protein
VTFNFDAYNFFDKATAFTMGDEIVNIWDSFTHRTLHNEQQNSLSPLSDTAISKLSSETKEIKPISTLAHESVISTLRTMGCHVIHDLLPSNVHQVYASREYSEACYILRMTYNALRIFSEHARRQCASRVSSRW